MLVSAIRLNPDSLYLRLRWSRGEKEPETASDSAGWTKSVLWFRPETRQWLLIIGSKNREWKFFYCIANISVLSIWLATRQLEIGRLRIMSQAQAWISSRIEVHSNAAYRNLTVDWYTVDAPSSIRYIDLLTFSFNFPNYKHPDRNGFGLFLEPSLHQTWWSSKQEQGTINSVIS